MESIVFLGFNLHAWITIATVLAMFAVMLFLLLPALLSTLFDNQWFVFGTGTPLYRIMIPLCITDYIAISETAAKFMFPKKIVRNKCYDRYLNTSASTSSELTKKIRVWKYLPWFYKGLVVRL